MSVDLLSQFIRKLIGADAHRHWRLSFVKTMVLLLMRKGTMPLQARSSASELSHYISHGTDVHTWVGVSGEGVRVAAKSDAP